MAKLMGRNNRTTSHIVRGAEMDGDRLVLKDIVVRITSDQMGKTISLSNEEDKMLMIPLEPIIPRMKEILK